MYSDDVEEASKEVDSLTRGGKGLRLFGVGGLGSELVEWEWGGPGSGKAVGMIKVISFPATFEFDRNADLVDCHVLNK